MAPFLTKKYDITTKFEFAQYTDKPSGQEVTQSPRAQPAATGAKKGVPSA